MRKIGWLVAIFVCLSSSALGQTAPAEEKAKLAGANAALKREYDAGNRALTAKNYDLAIAHYDAALKLSEQPPVLSNKAKAIHSRALAKYNSAVAMADGPAKTAAIETAKAEWKLAIEATGRAVVIARLSDGLEGVSLLQYLKEHAAMLRFVANKIDRSRIREATLAFNEYFKLEKDPAALEKARLEQAQFYLDINEYRGAALYFDAVLERSPNNLDAVFGMAMSCYGLGMEDSSYQQRSANAAKKFLDLAPASDIRRKDIQFVLEDLKASSNIVPK